MEIIITIINIHIEIKIKIKRLLREISIVSNIIYYYTNIMYIITAITYINFILSPRIGVEFYYNKVYCPAEYNV